MRTTTTIAFGAAACLLMPTAAHADEFLSGFFDAEEFALIEFSVSQNIVTPIFLDIHTNGSTNPDGSAADTEILLFSGLGPGAIFIESNDDDGIGLTSVLTYGSGSGLLLGDGFNLGGDGIADGENGELMAGSYTLIIGEFSTADPPGGPGDTLQSFIDAGDFGNEAVNYELAFLTNDAGFQIIPAPSVLAMLGLAGLAGRRRRRTA